MEWTHPAGITWSLLIYSFNLLSTRTLQLLVYGVKSNLFCLSFILQYFKSCFKFHIPRHIDSNLCQDFSGNFFSRLWIILAIYTAYGANIFFLAAALQVNTTFLLFCVACFLFGCFLITLLLHLSLYTPTSYLLPGLLLLGLTLRGQFSELLALSLTPQKLSFT